MASSIMNTEKGVCYICGAYCHTEEHHIFEGTSNRKISEQEGLKVYLCPECHRLGNYSIHMNPKSDMAQNLKREGQRTFEEKFVWEHPEYGASSMIMARLRFKELFGKSYLDMTEFE